MADSQRTHENNKSSLFEKLPPELLRAVNVAIVRPWNEFFIVTISNRPAPYLSWE